MCAWVSSYGFLRPNSASNVILSLFSHIYFFMKKKHVKPTNRSLRGKVSDRLQFPSDILLGEAILMMCENRRIQVQNVKGMVECTPDRVRLLTKKNRIEVIGKNLDVKEYSKDEILIQGWIQQVVYLEKHP